MSLTIADRIASLEEDRAVLLHALHQAIHGSTEEQIEAATTLQAFEVRDNLTLPVLPQTKSESLFDVAKEILKPVYP